MREFTVPRVTAVDHVRGHAGAAVTVLEYGDYECPYCRGATRDVHLLLDDYPETVRFVFRNFPIPQLHPHAEQAAEAAAAQGMFWEMYELLLQPPSHLDTDSLVSYAGLLGLDVGRFRSDLASRAYAARIERDVQEGIRNGVEATPKFYVNGERIDGKVPLEGLVDAVRTAVTAASASLTTESGAVDGGLETGDSGLLTRGPAGGADKPEHHPRQAEQRTTRPSASDSRVPGRWHRWVPHETHLPTAVMMSTGDLDEQAHRQPGPAPLVVAAFQWTSEYE
jgi:Thioredoxin